MKKEIYPIYDVKDFQYSGSEDDFSADTLSSNMRQYSE